LSKKPTDKIQITKWNVVDKIPQQIVLYTLHLHIQKTIYIHKYINITIQLTAEAQRKPEGLQNETNKIQLKLKTKKLNRYTKRNQSYNF